MSQVEVRLLGPLRARRADGEMVAPSEWRTAPTRALVAILALHGGGLVPVEQLLEALWPSADVASARARLRTAASQVRRVLAGPYVERVNDALSLSDAWVDVDAFTRLAAQARRHFSAGQLSDGIDVANEAFGLYAGDLCADLPYAEWLDLDRAHLRTIHLELLAEAGEAALEGRWWPQAVAFGSRLARFESTSERGCRILMRGHEGLSEIGAAVRAYARLREALSDELGVDPSAETQELHLRLLRAVPEGERDVAAPAPLREEGDDGEARAEEARRLLGHANAALLEVACVLEEPFTAAEVQRLIAGMDPSVLLARLDLLEDRLVLERQAAEYRFRPGVRDALYRWLRPSMRRALHERIARSDAVSREQRLRQWIAAGEPVRRSELVTASADQARPFARPTHWAVSIDGSLEDLAQRSVAERVSVLEAIAVSAGGAGRVEEARDAAEAALQLSDAHLQDALPRLMRRRAALRLPGEDALAWALRARATADFDDWAERSRIEMTVGREVRKWSNRAALGAFNDAAALADRSGDPSLRVRARAGLVMELVASRQSEPARRTAAEAAEIADASGIRELQAEGLLAVRAMSIWSGEARKALPPLERAWTLVAAGADVAMQARVALALARALHELGRPDGRRMWVLAGHLAEAAGRRHEWDLCAVQLTLEAGELRACRHYLERALEYPEWSAMQHQAVRILGARLHLAEGDTDTAASLLRTSYLVGQHSGADLLVPQAAARLAMLRASESKDEAEELLNTASDVAGRTAMDRESSVLLLARAAIASAEGQTNAAVGLGTAAAAAADTAGLVHEQAEALRFVNSCEQHAPRRPSGRLTLTAASITPRRVVTAAKQWSSARSA